MTLLSRLITGPLLLALSTAPAFATGASLPPYTPPAALQDIGAWDGRCPFILVIEGQSNARSTDVSGVKPTPANTYISNGGTGAISASPTQFVPAVFGTGVLTEGWVVGQEGTTSQTGITDPTKVFNNFAMHEAALIRATGEIPAARSIVILPNWYPGNDEALWVANGPSSVNWVAMQAQLTLISPAGVTASDGKVLTQVANCPVNHIMHFQGESNSDNPTGSYPAYDSMAGFLSGFTTWMAQWAATPQWTSQTLVTVQELATWNDTNANVQRNDAIHQLQDGLFNSQVTMVTSSGLIESAYPGPHWSGLSDPEVARRHFQAYRQGMTFKGFFPRSLGTSGTATVVNDNLAVTTGGTLVVGSESCRTGKMYITANGGTVTLPFPKLVPQGCEIEVYLQATTTFQDGTAALDTTYGCPGNNLTNLAKAQTVSPLSLSGAGQFLAKVTGAGCYWTFFPESPVVGTFEQGGQAEAAGSAVTLTAGQMYGSSYYLLGNTVTLPAPANGLWGEFSNGITNGDATLSVAAPYYFLLSDGTTSSTYPLSAGDSAHVFAQGLFWHVVGDTGNALGLKLPVVTKTASYTLTALDYAINGNATSVAFAVTLPACTTQTRKRIYTAKKIDSSANAVTLTAAGSDKIDGAATLALTSQYTSATIQCDGAANWWKR